MRESKPYNAPLTDSFFNFSSAFSSFMTFESKMTHSSHINPQSRSAALAQNVSTSTCMEFIQDDVPKTYRR